MASSRAHRKGSTVEEGAMRVDDEPPAVLWEEASRGQGAMEPRPLRSFLVFGALAVLACLFLGGGYYLSKRNRPYVGPEAPSAGLQTAVAAERAPTATLPAGVELRPTATLPMYEPTPQAAPATIE